MDNKKYFFLSAIAAVTIYIFIVISFFYYLDSKNVKKVAAISKNTVLQLDIILENKQVSKITSTTQAIKSKKSSKVVKKSKSNSAKRKSNLKSLFAHVKTKAAKITKKTALNIKQSSISSRFKSKFEKQKKVDKLTVSKLVKNKQTTAKKAVVSNVKKDTNPYFAKIYNLISIRWQPTSFFNNLKAKVLITISNTGTFSYKFIKYSNDTGFDTQLTNFLDQESTKVYPVNPNKTKTTIEISFQSKAE